MSAANTSIRDALYEAPGPKARKRIAVTTAISLAVLAALVIIVVRQFYITGQLDAKYWSLFTKYTTWRFLGRGLAGTLGVALAAGVVAFAVGLVLMLGRISTSRIARGLSTALIEFSRGVPTLLFIYF